MGNQHYIPVNITTDVTSSGETFADWNAVNVYRPFTIVKDGNDFYISIDDVPANTLITDSNYWVKISGSGGSTVTKTNWYGTCTSTSTTAQKAVTVTGFTTNDLTAGCCLSVYFQYAQAYNGTPTILINNITPAIEIHITNGSGATRYEWGAGSIVQMVYDGTYFIIANGNHATTGIYGKTILSTAVNSTSTTMSATPSAVKQAYDLASSKLDASIATNAQLLTTVSVTSGNLSSSDWTTNLSFTIPTGYAFVCFLQPRTNGWIGDAYVGAWNVNGSNVTCDIYWGRGGNGTISLEMLCQYTG